MEILTMGKVVVSARIENLQDTYDAEKGTLPAGEVRCVEVSDALVDTGATLLSIPRRLVAQLGLRRQRTRTAPHGCRHCLVRHLWRGSLDRPWGAIASRRCAKSPTNVPS